MRCYLSIAIVVALSCSSGSVVNATASLSPVDRQSVQGLWESVHWKSGTFFLLNIDKSGATLVISNGSAPADYNFRTQEMMVRKGEVSFSSEETGTGILLRATGTGLASGDIGLMTLVLRTIHAINPPWVGDDLVFMKRGKTSRLGRLVAAEEHALRLLDSTTETPSAGAARNSLLPRKEAPETGTK
jgi:hypothetical protein